MELTCYIVDDEHHCIASTTDLIIETGCFKIVGTATDPRKAINEIKDLKPKVIFTDINMPHISGIHLASQVDHIGLVVFISADMPFTYPQIDLNKNLFLGKPVSLSEFRKATDLIKAKLEEKSQDSSKSIL
jgi:two-component SAPR family response regulator